VTADARTPDRATAGARLRVDHVTIAGPALAPLCDAFAAVGLAPDYGGPHSNGATHMALVGFDDGSYIELISTLERGAQAPWWGALIAAGAGPAAWAVEADDVAAEVARLTAAGIDTTPPRHMTRTRPDGTLVEWDLAHVGGGEPGTSLPFIIRDRTPRSHRVRPSASVAGTELTGVAAVVVAVADLAAGVERYRRAYGWPEPSVAESSRFGARLAHVADTPVFLATPLEQEGWLAARIARFGDAPCAVLLRSADEEASARRFALSDAEGWFRRRVRWLEDEPVREMRLGIASADHGSGARGGGAGGEERIIGRGAT
jgi:hypothetical protein